MDRLVEAAIGSQEADPAEPVRLRVGVTGVVQGVGFRPFVYRLATGADLTGYVLNNPEGVEIEVQGRLDAVSGFLSSLVDEKPPQARIDTVSAHFLDLADDGVFEIRESSQSEERTVLISPDIATCRDCLEELHDPKDRRRGYPFINCTNCGPRYTIIADIPYDRPKTTMGEFEMCPDCRAEYGNPGDRRFHAEPNACWKCGPNAVLRAPDGREVPCRDPVLEAACRLAEGQILAVKGLGGFHLAVDARNPDAVERLRRRKRREEKPLALMARDLATARGFVDIGPEEELLLTGPSRPIVLLRKRGDGGVASAVAPGNRNLGVMLPYTPLHHLLLAEGPDVLVLTSGNISEEPIAMDFEEAGSRLAGIADLFLDHNRKILSRCDDSVTRVFRSEPVFLRRSRGWVPLPVPLEGGARNILACGAHLKNTVALTRGNQAFLSQHIGDLENLEAYRFFRDAIDRLECIADCKPEVIAHDSHPDYLSTRYALGSAIDHRIAVQHHHAHIASCLGEAGVDGPVIGLALDGTGYGADGTVWGCEILLASRRSFDRVGHLGQVGLPGAEAAVREPWRMAVAHLRAAFGDETRGLPLERLTGRGTRETDLLLGMLAGNVNCPLTSSAGRLFDAISCMCGVRDAVSYEGQAAIELEMAADEYESGCYRLAVNESDGRLIIEPGPMLVDAVDDILGGAGAGRVSARFHNWFAESLRRAAARLGEKHGIRTVALSGGCFQNLLLLERLESALAADGFRVLLNRRVPANDGGISYGQAVVAAAMTEAVC
jgi:hydrogenase maturation protein HypF